MAAAPRDALERRHVIVPAEFVALLPILLPLLFNYVSGRHEGLERKSQIHELLKSVSGPPLRILLGLTGAQGGELRWS